MNWDNKTTLKFLELYQINSCIWDPQDNGHKNRQRVNDAWNNIKENLGVACTIKDLKKKKESLMSAYRNYKTKIKKSQKSGSSASDVYQPSWFAFSFMDGFLGSVYTCNATVNTEELEVIEDANITGDTGQTTTTETLEPNISNPSNSTQEYSFGISTPPVRRRQKNPPELIEAKHHMEQAFNFMKQVSEERHHHKDIEDECTTFGQLVARKIRKLSEERRDVMMVKINQLFVDEHIMLNSHSSRPNSNSTLAYTPSPPQYQNVYSPPILYTQTTLEEESNPAEESQLHQEVSHIDDSLAPVQANPNEPFRSCSNREYIIPNRIYDGPSDTFKDLIIIKPK